MNLNIASEVAALRRLSTRELRAKYAEVFGDEARTTNNRVWLVRRIAWRLQALARATFPNVPASGRPNSSTTPTFACRRPDLRPPPLPRRNQSPRRCLPVPRANGCQGPAPC